MHGRPRLPKDHVPDPEAVEKKRQKLKQYTEGVQKVMAAKKAKQHDEETLKLCAALLVKNPDCYSLWNYRREAFAEILQAGGQPAEELARAEVHLTEKALRSNHKSYPAWGHRKWIIEHRLLPMVPELQLSTQALSMDERNFHAWNYRFWLVGLMGRSAAQELEFTEQKVCENFSNYSAWHYRSRYLPEATTMGSADAESGRAAAESSGRRVAADGAGVERALPNEVLEKEYELLRNALYTQPTDSSPWFYNRWLLGNSLASFRQQAPADAEDAAAKLRAVLEREVATCEELLVLEGPKCKWPLLTLVRLKAAQLEVEASADGKEALREEIRALYQRLADADPLRRGYFHDAASKVAAEA